MAGAAKRKVSLTLDADLIDALGASPRALSDTVNALLRLRRGAAAAAGSVDRISRPVVRREGRQ